MANEGHHMLTFYVIKRYIDKTEAQQLVPYICGSKSAAFNFIRRINVGTQFCLHDKFFRKPAMVETSVDLAICLVPLWVAVMIGLVIGWTWKPRWASLIFLGMRSRPRLVWTVPPGFGAQRLWFAVTALWALPVLRNLWYGFKAWRSEDEEVLESPEEQISDQRTFIAGQERPAVTEEDLGNLCRLLQEKDGGPAWQQIMDRSTPNMSYQAWRRDPEIGPTEYRSRTVIEDVTPELVRDFFWDDDFRSKWDDMLIYFKTLEECPRTGTMIVHWVRKFPFFCSDREYIIGRRIWESRGTYFCVTKGVPYPLVPRRNKPRRVDTYYSSWCIRAVESTKRDGQLTACEVMLFHREDMGIPRELAKIGVRQGMWGLVKKMDRGVHAYQIAQLSGSLLSRSALMARINTRVPADFFRTLGISSSDTEEAVQDSSKTQEGNVLKWLIVGGVVALACGLDRGILSKGLLLGVARRLRNIGKKM